MLGKISSSLTSNVKYYCDNTATAQLTAAVQAFEYYCSAAEKKVVATVSESVAQKTGSGTGTGSRPTQPSETGKGGSGSGNGTSSNSGKSDSSGTNKTAVIAGSVVGGVVALLAIGVVSFFLRRKQKKNEQGGTQETGQDNDVNTRPEMTGDSQKGSPVNEMSTPDYTQKHELQGKLGVAVAEMPPSVSPVSALHSGTTTAYAQSPHGQSPQEMASPYQAQPIYEAP